MLQNLLAYARNCETQWELAQTETSREEWYWKLQRAAWCLDVRYNIDSL